MHDLESRIFAIESRNARVETDKAWETSWTRKILIMILTYLFLGIYLQFLGVEKWFLHAMIPTFGYFFSTLALPAVRKMWELIK